LDASVVDNTNLAGARPAKPAPVDTYAVKRSILVGESVVVVTVFVVTVVVVTVVVTVVDAHLL
jgi:hypothetical protein